MLMVEAELRPSAIHGIGVFLLENVRKGDLIWRFDSRIDRVFHDHEFYSTYHSELGLWVLCGDNGRHFNHSDNPNTRSLGVAFGDDVAAADLKAGTELTTDYRTICDLFRMRDVVFEAA